MSDILIYEDIGPWGVSAKSVIDQLDENPSVRINSAGGDVFDGITISGQLWRRDSVGYIDGLAASSASVIAAGCRKVVAAVGSMLMIHEPWTMTAGNSEDMQSEAKLLDTVANQIAAIYQRKAGNTIDFWRGLMRAETWMTADEALSYGLVDVIDNGLSISNCTNLTKYNYSNKGKYMDIFNKERVSELEKVVEDRETKLVALALEHTTLKAQVEALTQEKGEAEARAAEAEAKAEALASEVEAVKVGVEAQIENARKEAVKALLNSNAPPAVEGASIEAKSHSQVYNELWEAKKVDEATAYMKAHRAQILRGE